MILRSARLLPLLGVALALAAMLIATGCEAEIRGPGADPEERDDFEEVDGEGAVPLIIIEGLEGSTLAYVPVHINGEGPFQFALDTGASNSVIASDLAEELGLEQVGEARPGVGVGGVAEARPVGVDTWSIGDIDLGDGMLLSMDLPEGGRETGMQGLLGSDILSAFGRVVVDYDEEVLYLGAVPEGAAAE